MESLKQEAINVISKLPETASMDEIMYRLFVVDKIRKAQAAAQRGESIPVEHLQKEMEAW